MNSRAISIASLPIEPADPASPVPLYHQVETSMRQMIEEGLLVPGDVLPPEIELSHAFDVGRHTMRTALSRLAADGLIMRKAGRGTVVMQRADRIQFFLDRSFTRQMSDMGRSAHSEVLETYSGVIDTSAPAVFKHKLGSPYFSVARLRFGDHEPIGVQQAMVITQRCPGLEHFDFNSESLYEVLAREYKLVIHEIRHSVRAVLADEHKARLLKVSEKSPLLVARSTAFLEDGEIIESTLSHYRADRYEYNTSDMFTPC